MPKIDNVVLDKEEKEEIRKLCKELVLNWTNGTDFDIDDKIQDIIDKVGEFVWSAFKLGKYLNTPR